jgi:photosystem II stability/assembly factor-like uncharacterized protein
MRLFGERKQDDPRVENALRASLLANARRAPSGDGLAERVLAAVDEPPPITPRPSKRWAGWALPAIAAASVAAVAAIAVGVANIGTGHPAAKLPPTRNSLSQPAPVNTPSVTSGTGSAAPSASREPTTGGTLLGVRVVDLTFAGTDDGWALASAHCVKGTGRCTALLRTHDGTHCRPMSGASFNVPGVRQCAAPCVNDVRFANDQIGYAFGPSAFFMTTNGGASWQSQPGGAIALETLNGNVVRVTARGTGCPAWCHVQVETAGIGSSAWTAESLPQHVPNSIGNFGISFARGGSDVYLLSLGHPAGGASIATSTLYRSTDNGRSWGSLGEPCPRHHGAVDSSALAAASAGRVAVVCTHRAPPQRSFVATSSDAGSTMTAQPGALPWPLGGQVDQLAGDTSTVLAAGGSSGLAVSRDGGRSWQRVAAVPGDVTFVGFESTQVGRVIAQNGRSIWTTRDSGRTWTPISFR